MKQFWNKSELLAELQRQTGFRLASITLWSWEKKGLFLPTGYMMNGKQRRPVYDEAKLNRLIKLVNKAQASGKKRLKLR